MGVRVQSVLMHVARMNLQKYGLAVRESYMCNSVRLEYSTVH